MAQQTSTDPLTPVAEEPGLLSTAEVASRLGVSRRQVQRLADDGTLTVVEVDESRRFWFDSLQVAQVAVQRGADPDPELGLDDVEAPPEISAMIAQAVHHEVEVAMARATRAEVELEVARAEIERLKAAVRALTGE